MWEAPSGQSGPHRVPGEEALSPFSFRCVTFGHSTGLCESLQPAVSGQVRLVGRVCAQVAAHVPKLDQSYRERLG